MTQQSADYHGTYINLDRSGARRERMDAELAKYGLQDRYTRFAAIDGATLSLSRPSLRPSEAGAFSSHARALDAMRPRGTAVHILEDDALLSTYLEPVIQEAIQTGLFERFDILFTDVLFGPHLGMLKGLKELFDRLAGRPGSTLRLSDLQVMDLAGQNFSCLTSYVVGAKSIDRVLALYGPQRERGPEKPIDLFIRDCVLAGKLSAACIFPFISSFRLEEIAGSTIAGQASTPNPSVMILAVLRYLFFMDRDLTKAKKFLDSATKENRRKTNPHHEMIVQALEFVLSADFQEF